MPPDLAILWLGLLVLAPLAIAVAARAVTRESRLNAGHLAIGLIVTFAAYYVLWYDTAESKCYRGDVGACLVYQSR